MDKKKKSTLKENKRISQPEITNTSSIKHIKSKRRLEVDTQDLITSILKKDRIALSRAITLIESKNNKHKEKANAIIKSCLPHANKSIRIGITGIPGVGKSTFIEALGKYLTSLGKRLAILTIDPSSSLTKGSILGDKTRMEHLAKDNNVFIRPSASGGTLGGVARKTRETIIVCEAAGFNVILIETVGVGQSETAVHSMVDFFLLLKLAGTGDELQGIKRGIIEMADTIAINKADGNNLKHAKLAKVALNQTLNIYPKKVSNWQPKVILCSAIENFGINTIWNTIQEYIQAIKKSNYFEEKRKNQNKFWLMQTIEEQLKSDFFNNPIIKKELEKQLLLIENNKRSPFLAAEYLLALK